jgi:hypothetical protein
MIVDCLSNKVRATVVGFGADHARRLGKPDTVMLSFVSSELQREIPCSIALVAHTPTRASAL